MKTNATPSAGAAPAPAPPGPSAPAPAPLPPQPPAWRAKTEKVQRYVFEHPWKTLGILLAAGAVTALWLPSLKAAQSR